MTTSQLPDFRPDLAAAQAWVGGLIDSTTTTQFTAPTPCTEFDVRALLEHLHSQPAKLRAIAAGEDPRLVPSQVPFDENDPGGEYRAGSLRAQDAWSDDELLHRTVIAPWGPVPGAIALGGMVMEIVTHGWDLAVATGQPSEAEPQLAAKAMGVAERALTDDFRGPDAPFGPRIEPRPGAGPTERLAAFLGRTRPSTNNPDLD